MIVRFIIAILFLVLIGGGLVGFNIMRDKGIAAYFANQPVPSTTVSTAEAAEVTWTPLIDAIGTVGAARGIDLTVEATGIVKEIRFEANQTVAKGDLLIHLDDAVQRADLEAARTQAALDRQSLQRAKELSARGVSSGVTLDTAEAVASASGAQVARAEAVLEQKQLRAPFDGTIGIPNVDLGQYVSPGTKVATLQDLDVLYVDFTIPEQSFNHLRIGQQVRLGVEEDALKLPGDVIGIDPKVDPATRLASVRAAVTGSDKVLTPGQFVQVQVELPVVEGVIVVPQTAVVTSLYGDHVYVVRPADDAEATGDQQNLVVAQVFVTVGRRQDGMAEIVKGLEAGESVVTAGQNRLSNGAPVVVDNTVTLDTAQSQAETPAASE